MFKCPSMDTIYYTANIQFYIDVLCILGYRFVLLLFLVDFFFASYNVLKMMLRTRYAALNQFGALFSSFPTSVTACAQLQYIRAE